MAGVNGDLRSRVDPDREAESVIHWGVYQTPSTPQPDPGLDLQAGAASLPDFKHDSDFEDETGLYSPIQVIVFQIR
jgi:hypothetical protein